jgi:hypothetical protein
MNVICAFSSDNRTLYKADIYRVLALPKGHIVHFRYKKKYVDDNLLQDNAKLINEKVAIFFTHGNNDQEKNNQLTSISIRWATISHFEVSTETDVFHAYMKLESFCNVAIDSGNSLEKQPPTKFFSKLLCTESSERKNWQNRINEVKGYFPKITFFYLQGIYKKDKEQILKYQYNERSCYYDLIHGDRYVLKMSLGNPDSSETKIEITDTSEEITINCINPIETSVQFDDYDIPVSVKTLQVMKQASLLTFKPIDDNNNIGEYATNIELNLKLNPIRPLVFGFFSTLAFWALLSVKSASSVMVWPQPWEHILPSLLIFISTSVMFFLFNKK